jgi:hypothetical protein
MFIVFFLFKERINDQTKKHAHVHDQKKAVHACVSTAHQIAKAGGGGEAGAQLELTETLRSDTTSSFFPAKIQQKHSCATIRISQTLFLANNFAVVESGL